jgi:hypothetical protein
MEPTTDDWIFDRPVAQNVTGKISLLYWYTDDEIAEYDFRLETKYMDVREEQDATTQEPIF